MNTRPPDNHKAFIKAQLPTWLAQAPPDLLRDFRDSLIGSNQARHDLKAFMQTLKSPEAFACPLLRHALRTRFFGLLEDENAILIREWKHSHLLGLIKNHARTTRQTLLEAALQNYEASEAQAGGMEAGTGLYNATKTAEVLTGVAPAAFASLCRSLDLGGQYQQHLRDILEPAPLSNAPHTAAQVRGLFRAQAQHAFGVALHMAYMQKAFTPLQHLQLHSLQRTGNHTDIRYGHLTINQVVLPAVLVIQAPTIGMPFLLYTPDDPRAAFRQHPSLKDLEHSLAERLLEPRYLTFFERLTPLQHQQTLLKVNPAWVNYASMTTPGKLYRASLDKPVSVTAIPRNLFQAMAQQRITQIRSDARTLAVPTADVDLLSRQKRLQGYEDIGKSLLFFAASFIPIVGEVLLMVSAVQLINSVYDGFAAWSRGDSDEALNDLLDVVDNVALAAATAGAIKAAGVATRLVKVQVHNRGWRLWNPDLTPYRHPKALPAHLAADTQGVYLHEEQRYLKLDDQHHAVQLTPDGKQWHLPHPSAPHAYSPQMLSNTVGGWRCAHEKPEDWSDLKLIKRLGPDATNITQPAVEPILLLGGVDSLTLRQTYQDMTRPPPLLRDMLSHFNLEQEINDFSIDRAEGKTLTPYSPQIQFHLVCSLPEWPATYRLNIVDEQHNVLLTHGAGTVELQVSATRWRNGELLHALQEQLPQEDFNKLLPTPYIDYFSKVENLALRLHDQAQQQKPQLFALINSVRETAVTEVEKDILAQAPGLSKTHVEEMAATLSQNERQRLHQDKSLPPHQQWEAGQYLNAIRAARAREGIYLDAPHNPDSIALMLYALEQLPGWPGARIEVYDDSNSGPLLGSIGSEPNSVRHILIRRGQQYIAQDTQGADLHLPGDLFSTLERSLGEPLRQALVSRSSAHSLKAAVQRRSLSLIAQHPPRRASAAAQTLSQTNDAALDTLFAEPSPPQGMTLRADGIYQAPPLPDGSYPCYILDQQHYYRVKSDDLGWQLIDARSPFRAYRPYVRRTTPGGWEIDPAKGALMGGMPEVPAPRGAPMDSSDEFESARSSSDYESAEEGAVKVLYTPHELAHMRSERSYQYSQNYRRIYDRANNGRYPLRNEQGRALRIKRLQNFGKSLTSPTLFSKQLVLPYIQWEGFENVARLYEDKLEVVPFTAAHQKFPEEAALIGQATVMTRKPIKRGEALGVYGGELLPYYIAAFRQDPYIIDVKPFSPTPAAPPPVLSGDNIISRINTILEYEGGVPARQAASGYNVEAAVFNADVQAGAAALERFEIKVMFASEDIPAATELRWNYQYNEATVRALFGPLPNSH